MFVSDCQPGREQTPYFQIPGPLILHKGSVYVLAQRSSMEPPRCFKADRFHAVELLKKAANIPDGFSCEEFMSGSFGVFTPEDTEYLVRIRFTKIVSGAVLESMWHKTQKHVVLANGDVELSFRLRGLKEIKTWILSWGPHAQVQSPVKLIDMVRDDLNDALNRYLT